MAKLKNKPRTARTTNSTSGYRGGMRAASVERGGKLGRKGQFVTRRQRYYDMRLAMGLAGG